MADEIRADLLIGRDTLSPALEKAGRDAAGASSSVKDLTKNLYELGKQRATPVVDLQDKDADARLTDLVARLKALSDRVASPSIDVKDKAAQASVAAMQVRLDSLSKKVASPRITLEGVARAQAQILALDVQLDRLGGKTAGPGGRSILSRLGGLFYRGAGDRGAGSGGLFGRGAGSLLSSLFGPGSIAGPAGAGQATGGAGAAAGGGPLLYGGAALLAGLLAPALIPTALGGLVGAGAAGGALMLGSRANTQLQALQSSLKGTTGRQRQRIQAQIAALRQSQGGELGVYGAFQDVGQAGLAAFSKALEARGPGYSAGPGGQAGAPSFLTSLRGILEQIERFIRQIGPSLGDLFRSSVPYLQMFVKFLEQAAKVLLPVFTAMLKQFQPYLPLIAQGFMNIVQGIAGFLKALGPQGMKTAAQIFVIATKGIMYALEGIGWYLNRVGTKLPEYIHNIASWFDWLRHHTATVFDGIRHDIAHYWDMTFENTIGTVIRAAHDIEAAFDATKKFVESWVLRLEILFAGWAKNMLTFFADAFQFLPGIIPGVNKLKAGLDRSIKDLSNYVTQAQAQLHRLTSHPYTIAFGVSLPAGVVPGRTVGVSGKAAYAGGTPGAAAGWAVVGERGPELVHMRGGETVIPNHALRGYAAGTGLVTVHLSTPSIREMASVLGSAVARIVRSVQSQYTAAIPSGFGGSGVARWAPLVLRVLAMLGQPAADLGTVLSQMMTESGGNPGAINLWDSNAAAGDPSRGLMQVIGSTFAAYAGPFRGLGIYNPLANIYAGLNYAINRYGAGWTSVLGHGHGYDRGGYLPPGLSLAYNATGRPEMVVPSGGRAVTVIVKVDPAVAASTPDRRLGQHIAQHVTAAIRGGMALYPAGMTPR